jgi:uncharacterized phage protein gp47/JayE
MAEYIDLALTADATALSDESKEYMAAAIPGWVARPGNVESILLEANGQMGAEVIEQASEVPPVVFAYYGQWLLGIALRQATPSTGVATFTFDGLATVPAGSLFTAPNPDGNTYVFQTDTDVRSDTPPFTTGATALEPGADANGSSGTGEMLDAIDGVGSVALSGTTGGSDEEDANTYLDRLTDALTILAPRPILPADFATLARQVPGVGRTLSIDLYQPPASSGGVKPPTAAWGAEPNGTTPVERCDTVAITKTDGTAPDVPLMQSVYTVLDSAREVNFLVYVIPPKYTTIDVQATVTAFSGFTQQVVKEAAEAMLRAWLDPLQWGSQGTGEIQAWQKDTKARIYEAVDYLNRADGVYYVETIQLRKHLDPAWSNVDIALTGAAPLPLAGDINVTVNLPT